MADFDPVERYAKPEEDERVLSRSHGLALEAVGTAGKLWSAVSGSSDILDSVSVC